MKITMEHVEIVLHLLLTLLLLRTPQSSTYKSPVQGKTQGQHWLVNALADDNFRRGAQFSGKDFPPAVQWPSLNICFKYQSTESLFQLV